MGHGQIVHYELVNHVRELEDKDELTHSDWLALKRLQQWLTNTNGEFKTYHLDVDDLLEEEENQENEQAAPDDHWPVHLAQLATP